MERSRVGDASANGEGSGGCPPNPSWSKHQPACKPGSVGHRTSLRSRDTRRPFLWCRVRTRHPATYPDGEPDIAPAAVVASANWLRVPSLFGLAPGGVYHAGSVAGPAVRSYRTFSPLPRRSPRRGEGGRFVLCGTFPGVAPAGRYPAPYVNGARTFLSDDLSVLAGAAVQPTDHVGNGHPARPRQGPRLAVT